jgi:hypothetical protein
LILAVAVPGVFVGLQLTTRAKPSGVHEACAEPKAKRAAPGKKGVQLQANRARPTMALALADKTSDLDTISFSSKGRQRVPDNPRARTSAFLIETLRKSPASPYEGRVTVKANGAVGTTVVRLTVCVSRGKILSAGAFQGTVRIYGPRVADFDYAVIVTQKWPWYVAASILWYAGLLFVIVAWRTQSLTFNPVTPSKAGVGNYIATVTGIVLGLIAMVPTFFGTYWNNATWGSDPGTQISGLAIAGLTAALAGLAAAHKLLEKATQPDAK